jgi:hypothetical protein
MFTMDWGGGGGERGPLFHWGLESYITRDGIHESTISLIFLGIFLRFLSLEDSTFVFVFPQNAIYEQT